MILVTGYHTTIVQELIKQMPGELVLGLISDLGLHTAPMVFPPGNFDKFVYAAGTLHQKPLIKQTPFELKASLYVNFVSAVRFCEKALTYSCARVVVVGSKSAWDGSYDEMYAGMKAALHCYVENRKVDLGQSIDYVAPGIIADSGMTRRRHDYPAVLSRRHTVTAAQVASEIMELLWL